MPPRRWKSSTLDEMLEARKAAGTADRDLGQSRSKPTTAEQRAFLAREGCRLQGYLIGRPEPMVHCRYPVAGLAEARGSIASSVE
jgi:hypothetical protein